MKTLNLINPEKSDIQYERLTFPDSQPHIKLVGGFINLSEDIQLVTRLSTPSDVMLLLFVSECLRNDYKVKNIHLIISYLMSARMDRRMEVGEPCSLRAMARLLNAQWYADISVFDPHSGATELLIDRCNSVPTTAFMYRVLTALDGHNGNKLLFVAPDAGAAKKTDALGKKFESSVLHCSKTRDTKNGALSGFHVPEEDLKGKHCLVIDDICDGGGTFIGLAKALKEKNAGHLYLAVSHGIFSRGLSVLSDFDHVFTTNSYKEQEANPLLTTIKLW